MNGARRSTSRHTPITKALIAFIKGGLGENYIIAVLNESFSARTIISKIPMEHEGGLGDIREL